MGNICCSPKDQEQSRGPAKPKGGDDFDEVDTLSSHTNSNNVNVNDSLYLEYAQKLQRQQSKAQRLRVQSWQDQSNNQIDFSATQIRDDSLMLNLPSSFWMGQQMTLQEIERYEQLLVEDEEEDIDCIQKGEMTLLVSQETAKSQAVADHSEPDTLPVLLEYLVPHRDLLSNQLTLPGTRTDEIVFIAGSEWFVKDVLNNDRKSRKKRNNFVTIQLEIYAKENEE